jgi:hypothetical protein
MRGAQELDQERNMAVFMGYLYKKGEISHQWGQDSSGHLQSLGSIHTFLSL